MDELNSKEFIFELTQVIPRFSDRRNTFLYKMFLRCWSLCLLIQSLFLVANHLWVDDESGILNIRIGHYLEPETLFLYRVVKGQ